MRSRCATAAVPKRATIGRSHSLVCAADITLVDSNVMMPSQKKHGSHAYQTFLELRNKVSLGWILNPAILYSTLLPDSTRPRPWAAAFDSDARQTTKATKR